VSGGLSRRELLVGVAGAAALGATGLPGWMQEPKEQGMEPLQVGDRKQLFIDDRFLAEQKDVRLVMCRPVQTGERCIVPDRPWEGHRVCAYNSVAEDGGTLKMWYDAIDNEGGRWLCYATSQDGIHWEKPDLGLVPFQGDRHTNIVFPLERTEHEPSCVFLDTNPACPARERYKMACTLKPAGKETATYVGTSEDGLRWQMLPEPAFRASDTANICWWDDRLGRYVAYVRTWTPMRMVGRCETADFGHWGKEQVVFGYDDEDQRALNKTLFSDMDFYTSAAVKYPGAQDVYLLFPTAYYHYRPEVAERIGRAWGRPWGGWHNDGPMDIQIAVSRDGIAWERPDREPFIRLGEAGGWDGGYAYLASGLILRPDEIWLYYATAAFTHGNYDLKQERNAGTITRAVLRRDGFMALAAGYGGGECTTWPLVFAGNRLALNVDAGAGGHAVVEMQDGAGKPVPGFTAADCDPVNGSRLHGVVSWQGKSDLGALAGRPLRMRIALRSARLYAFQFEWA